LHCPSHCPSLVSVPSTRPSDDPDEADDPFKLKDENHFLGLAETDGQLTNAAQMAKLARDQAERAERQKQQQLQLAHVLPRDDPPSAQHLLQLPFVARFCPRHDDLHSLLLQEHRATTSVAKCKALVKKVKDDVKKTEYDLEQPRQQLAIAQRIADDIEARVTRAIDKHYRVSSIKLHPDRVGEQARPAFEELTEARNYLRNPISRRKYIDQMLDIVTIRVGELPVPPKRDKDGKEVVLTGKERVAYMEQVRESNRMTYDPTMNHKSWVGHNPLTNFTEEATNAVNDNKKARQQDGRPLALTGGIAHDTPRKAQVAVLSLPDRVVKIRLPLPEDQYQFLQYCDRVQVVGDTAFLDREVDICSVDMDIHNPIGSDAIETSAKLPEEGVWYIKWYAQLNIDGRVVNTPHSYETTIDVTSTQTIKLRTEVVEMSNLARSRTADIVKTLRGLRSVTGPSIGRSRQDLESRYWHLHSVLAKARSTHSRLTRLVTEHPSLSSGDSATALAELASALQEAKPIKAELDETLSTMQKRDALQSFKGKIATHIEEGGAIALLESCTPDFLARMGGEPNRLYQLLVEGKGKQYGALELDSDILAAAAKRSDMFSSKQIKALEERRIDAEEAIRAETARLKCEAEEKSKIEAERKEAEERALRQQRFLAEERRAFAANAERLADEKRGLTTGAVVRINALKNAAVQSLNGTTATIKGRSSAYGDSSGQDRYHVICHETGEVKSILAKNLFSLVEMAEDEEPNSPATAAPAGTLGEWTCSACTFLHTGSLARNNSCNMCETPRGNIAPSEQVLAATRQAQTRQAVGDFSEIKARKAPAQAQAPAAQKKASPKPAVAPAPKVKVIKDLSALSASPSSNVSSPRTASTAGNTNRSHRPCRDGKRCRFLPDKCNFYHTAEEIRSARANHKPRFIKKTAMISSKVVGSVIGHGGSNIQKIHRDTRCNIWIDQESMAAHEMRLVDVSGHADMVDLALEMIKVRNAMSVRSALYCSRILCCLKKIL
jgi:hypothetical protein